MVMGPRLWGVFDQGDLQILEFHFLQGAEDVRQGKQSLLGKCGGMWLMPLFPPPPTPRFPDLVLSQARQKGERPGRPEPGTCFRPGPGWHQPAES